MTVSAEQVVAADREVRELEDQLVACKSRRDALARAALEAGASKYSLAKATGRTISSVQRWVN